MYQVKIRDSVQLMDGEIARPIEDVEAERYLLKTNKAIEIQMHIDDYKSQQVYQNENGGPGPVADFETMKIVNEYNSQFEVVFED